MHTAKRFNFVPSLIARYGHVIKLLSMTCKQKYSVGLLENPFVSSCCLEHGCDGWNFRRYFISLKMEMTCQDRENKDKRSLNLCSLWSHHFSPWFLTSKIFLFEKEIKLLICLNLYYSGFPSIGDQM